MIEQYELGWRNVAFQSVRLSIVPQSCGDIGIPKLTAVSADPAVHLSGAEVRMFGIRVDFVEEFDKNPAVFKCQHIS